MMAAQMRAAMTTIALMALAAGSTWLLTGSYGCEIDQDCAEAGVRYCMGWPHAEASSIERPWWAHFKQYRSCEQLCGTAFSPCPGGYFCTGSSHGEPSICVPKK
ncbi:hypothetical protein F0U60_40210 [Archangium minus]|uniref:Secreted protein n=1 Tax=Archangium minus TaxID=83450 RepID=A0ABY9X2N2_9BACT|nr:hypothetical protein F0U60_40210 [Archangium minus]